MLKIVKSKSLKNDPLAGMSPQVFLKQYWQRKPVLFRGAISDFSSLLSRDEFFGLASSGQVTARFVSRDPAKAPSQAWTLKTGRLSKTWCDKTLGSRRDGKNWTILVQDVDKIVAKTRSLVEKFNFVPEWRRDDLMVSFAVPGGTVGPHVDRYDVFLVQMSGQREWRLGPADSTDFIPDIPLRVLSKFRGACTVTCEPGDILYLPPGLGHYGIAKTECLTYSVGYRAPSSSALVDAIFAAVPGEGPLYQDAGLEIRKNPGEVLPADFERIGTMFQELTRQRPVCESILDLITGQAREAHFLAPRHQVTISEAKTWRRNPSSRVAFTDFALEGLLYFSVDGRGETVHDKASAQLCRLICGDADYPYKTLQKLASSGPAKRFLATLIKQGLLIPAR